MLVKDLLEPEFVMVSPTDTICDAWLAMRNAGQTGAVVVTDDGRIVGFITDGDLIRSCMPSESDITIYDEIIDQLRLPDGFVRQLRSMKVEHAMQSVDSPEDNPAVITIDAREPMLRALALMFQHRLRRIPVTEGQNLIGVISRGQVLSHLLLERELQSK